MKELIKYLEKILTIRQEDLIASDDERVALHAKIELLEMIKEIEEKGFPDD